MKKKKKAGAAQEEPAQEEEETSITKLAVGARWSGTLSLVMRKSS